MDNLTVESKKKTTDVFSWEKSGFFCKGLFRNGQLFGNTWDSLIIFNDRMEIIPPKLWITTHCKETQDGEAWSLEG